MKERSDNSVAFRLKKTLCYGQIRFFLVLDNEVCAIVAKYQPEELEIRCGLLARLNSFIMPMVLTEELICLKLTKILEIVVIVKTQVNTFVIRRPNLYEYDL